MKEPAGIAPNRTTAWYRNVQAGVGKGASGLVRWFGDLPLPAASLAAGAAVLTLAAAVVYLTGRPGDGGAWWDWRVEAMPWKDRLTYAAAIATGAGALVALVVSYRKQRDAEEGKYAAHFAAAAAQLGDQAPAVRIAGAYAVAALADRHRSRRQQCIDLLTGYLRLPYSPTATHLTGTTVQRASGVDGAQATITETNSYRPADREVRLSIISIIRDHLTDPTAPTTWCGYSFDFRGATFDGGSFAGAHFTDGRVSFSGATFTGGRVSFVSARFSGGTVNFGAARFSDGMVDLSEASFLDGRVSFPEASFSGGEVSFSEASFSGGEVSFSGASFSGGAVNFLRSTFTGGRVSFSEASFSGGEVSFSDASFSGSAVSFARSLFSGGVVRFSTAKFCGSEVSFAPASFSGGVVSFVAASFSGGTVDFSFASFSGAAVRFPGAVFSGGKVNFLRAIFSVGTVDFTEATFSGGTVDFLHPEFSGGEVSFAPASFSGGEVIVDGKPLRRLTLRRVGDVPPPAQ